MKRILAGIVVAFCAIASVFVQHSNAQLSGGLIFPGPGLSRASSTTPIASPITLGSATSSGTTVTTTMTYGANVPAGALLTVAASNSNLLAFVSAVDTCGNTFTNILTSGNNTANTNVISLAYKENATACAAGQTLTVTTAAGSANRAIQAAYTTGIITSGSLDKSATAVSAVGTPSAATGTLSQSNEIVFGVTTSNGTITKPTAFTQIATFTPPNSDQEYDKVAATTTVTFNPTTGISGAGVVVASFKGF